MRIRWVLLRVVEVLVKSVSEIRVQTISLPNEKEVMENFSFLVSDLRKQVEKFRSQGYRVKSDMSWDLNNNCLYQILEWPSEILKLEKKVDSPEGWPSYYNK